MTMPPVLFPLWQPTYAEYTAICRYLGLSPQPWLFPRLLTHLSQAAIAHPPLSNWARHLARRKRSRFWIARMDLASRLFMPSHPVRHWLNATLALHECTARGHAELSQVPRGHQLIWSLPHWGLSLAWSAVLTGAWLCLQGVGYVLTLAWRQPYGRLFGQRVLVTGASRGLGWDLACLALEHGAHVFAIVRNRQHLPDAVSMLPPEAPLDWIEADLAVPGALTRALEDAGLSARGIDYALLAAGTKRDATPVTDESAVRQTFQINLFANVEFAAWYHARQGHGRIVLISSMGRWHGMPDTGGYNASKAALSIWGESLDMERYKGKPGVLIVEPGLFASDMVRSSGLQRRLSLNRRLVAERILEATLRGRRSLRPPLWFALLTWGLCLAGRGLRVHVLRRARNG